MEKINFDKLGEECVEQLTLLNLKDDIKAFVRMAVEFGYKKAVNKHESELAGNCFWGHKWGKWEQYSEDKFNVKYGVNFTEIRQKRTCLRCGKVESEVIY
jgi:hypothetical protein